TASTTGSSATRSSPTTSPTSTCPASSGTRSCCCPRCSAGQRGTTGASWARPTAGSASPQRTTSGSSTTSWPCSPTWVPTTPSSPTRATCSPGGGGTASRTASTRSGRVDTDSLKRNWAEVAAHGDQVPLFFYSTLFLAHPHLRDMFPLGTANQRDKLL